MKESSPRVGIGLGPGTAGLAPATDILEYGRVSDEIGFAHFWVNDHVSWAEPLLDPLVLLASIASVTKQIELGTGVYLLPLRPPAIVARAFSSLDYMSNGRALLGVGVGGEFSEDFVAAGVPLVGRGRRADRSLALIRRLMTAESVACDDGLNKLESTTVLPHPVRQPMPIIVGGRSEAALRRVVQYGDGWLPYLMSPDRLSESLHVLDRLLIEAQRPREELRIIAHVFVCFGDTKANARASAIEYLSRQYKADMAKVVDRSVPHGPPEACAQFVQRYLDSGATEIVIRPIATGDSQLKVLRGPAAEMLRIVQG